MVRKTRLLIFSLLILIISFFPLANITISITSKIQDIDSVNKSIFSLNPVFNEISFNDKNLISDKESIYNAAEKSLSNFFLENKGQVKENFLFYTKITDITIGFTHSQIIFLDKDNKFSVNFLGTNDVNPKGLNKLDSLSNYYFGNKHFTKISHYSQIIYENLYDGISLIYKYTDVGVKYDFVIEPYADISQISMKYEGIDNLEMKSNSLSISKETTTIYDENLVAWYEDSGEIIPINFVELDLDEESKKNNNQIIGFSLERNFDSSRRIIIDPLICSFSTFLGGSSTEHSIAGADIGEKSMDIDNAGNIIIAGRTSSTDFPIVQGYMDTFSGACDACIVKMDSDGQSLIFATYFGGNDEDWVSGCAVDSDGNIVVCGPTFSDNFPLQNAFQDTFCGSSSGYSTDAFLAKFDDTGSLIFSTLWGGSQSDWGYGVAFDSSDNIYFTGVTSSDDMFTKNAYQGSHSFGTNGDMFLAKFAPNGQSVDFSTYFGGSGAECAYDIEIDSNNKVVIVGSTDATSYPTLNPYQTSVEGLLACAVCKFSSTGTLEYSSTVDGNVQETVYGVAFDSLNNIILVGGTTSTNFPISGATQSTNAGGLDIFITKLSSDGQSLLYSTYFGGTGGDEAHDVILDEDGNYVVAGKTTSSNFPIKHAYQYSFGGSYDAFITVIAGNGNLLSSSYLGSSDLDAAIGVRVDSSNYIIVGGYTLSSNFPVENAFQASKSGTNDMFVSKFELDLTLPDITPTTSESTETTEDGSIPIVTILGILSLIGGCIVLIRKKKIVN
ncbi:MAG: hypothetical protein EAX90_11080 [Candidatus Heimdallarchaeota archaeon]|nr:hypothetical protein [Candidatus Heimdallarchaeota archaeon]